MRLSVDFHVINAVCMENTYPLFLMKDMLNHLSKGKMFMKLNFKEAYYQICIWEGDEWKTAFNCLLGNFQFRVMPFWLQGAPTFFKQLINKVLYEHLYKGVLVYLNDILIFSETLEEYIKVVQQVLKTLLAVK
ncbi:PREDICTED: RNA-directed DNA polymerase homolog [Thamnophis sirtalis]|uniref:ribonuclease H n=1 Tax=Thamnophis sirtalis TaxID=35019 RepID=A0A6I9YW60_9SAUR|nr:PREDICTED: RNA-directed DNA polymerase homolog [Thamnophis sirtalis]